MKKLFVILPLVLVLVLSSLPVMAEEKLPVWNGIEGTWLYMWPKDVQFLQSNPNNYPVWVARAISPNLAANADVKIKDAANFHPGFMKFDFHPWYDGVATWIKFSPDMADLPSVGEYVMDALGLSANWRILRPYQTGIIKVDVNAVVPASWIHKTGSIYENIDVKLAGLLLIVEPTTLPVLVRHHIQRADEYILEENQTWGIRDGELTPARVPEGWITKAFADVKYDPARTTVSTAWSGREAELVAGEQVVEGYIVDMYYTAPKAEEKKADEGTDAAKANAANVAANTATTNAKAAQASANLPATGAADTLYVALSSLALVALGVFFKK